MNEGRKEGRKERIADTADILIKLFETILLSTSRFLTLRQRNLRDAIVFSQFFSIKLCGKSAEMNI